MCFLEVVQHIYGDSSASAMRKCLAHVWPTVGTQWILVKNKKSITSEFGGSKITVIFSPAELSPVIIC